MVTHPFHPLCGREFALVVGKNNWAEDRVSSSPATGS